MSHEWQQGEFTISTDRARTFGVAHAHRGRRRDPAPRAGPDQRFAGARITRFCAEPRQGTASTVSPRSNVKCHRPEVATVKR